MFFNFKYGAALDNIGFNNEISMLNSSDKLFADIGVNNPDEALVKARLAHVVARAIDAREITQLEAAELLRAEQQNHGCGFLADQDRHCRCQRCR